MKKQALKKSNSKKTWLEPRQTWLRTQFPNIYRIITDRHFLLGILLGSLSIIVVTTGYDLFNTLQIKKELDLERQKVISQIQYWQSVARRYQGYRDAYIELAILENRLGENKKAKRFVQKSLAIDPNFEPGRQLENMLQ